MIKILFAGSPDAARLTLERLFEAKSACGFEIAGVLSNPPSAKGRHKELIPTPVAAFAAEKGIPVFTPEHLDGAAREAVSPLGADLLVSFAYGHIFGPKFLALFPMGGINLHPSLLPKYRGCTPVPAAILNRDKETAVTVQSLSLKMDEGDILAQTHVDLNGTETTESLLNYSAEEGARLICEVIKQTAAGGKLPAGTPQNGEASWSKNTYWNDYMENSGCGITAMSVILSGYGKSVTPEDLRNKYYPVIDYESLDKEFSNSYGIKATGFFYDSTHLSKKYINEHLLSNRPVLICVWNKPNENRWTTTSHYMVLLASDGDDMVYISNPNRW